MQETLKSSPIQVQPYLFSSVFDEIEHMFYNRGALVTILSLPGSSRHSPIRANIGSQYRHNSQKNQRKTRITNLLFISIIQ